MARPLNQWPREGPGAPRHGSFSDVQINHNERRAPQLAPSQTFLSGFPPPRATPLSLVIPRDPVQSSHVRVSTSSLERPSPPCPPTHSNSFTSSPAPRAPHHDFRASPIQITTPASERASAVSSPQTMRPYQRGHSPSTTSQYYSGRIPHLTSPVASASASTSGARPGYPLTPAVPSQTPSPPSSHTQFPRQEARSNMTVQAILNDDSSTSKLPERGPPQAAQADNVRYDLSIRQQPARARSCGFGDRDRRVIDPPPILQLRIEGPGLSREETSKKLRLPSYVVHCSIWSEDGEEEMSGMPDDYARQKRLMGSLVASPFVGSDEHGDEGCFFCFTDISCRTPGRYRLKFVLVVLDWPLRPSARSMVRAELLSDVFQTFSAKDFPGMLESTPLAKALKYQGCNIPTKKGGGGGGSGSGGDNRGSGRADDGSEERSDGGGEAAAPRRKRARNNDDNYNM